MIFLKGRTFRIQKIFARFLAKQQVAKHAHMINEQSAKRSALCERSVNMKIGDKHL